MTSTVKKQKIVAKLRKLFPEIYSIFDVGSLAVSRLGLHSILGGGQCIEHSA